MKQCYSFPEAVFKEKQGVWDHILELTIALPYVIVVFGVSFPPHLQRESDWLGNVSLYWLGIFYLNNQKEKGEYEGGGGKR